MRKKTPSFDRDKDGNKYKHPERDCKQCKNWPCFEGIETIYPGCNFAKYGCRLFT